MKRFNHPETGLQYVSTTDLHLTAFFGVSGIELADAELDQRRRTRFIFLDSELLKGLTVTYYANEGLVEPNDYKDKIYDLKAIALALRNNREVK